MGVMVAPGLTRRNVAYLCSKGAVDQRASKRGAPNTKHASVGGVWVRESKKLLIEPTEPREVHVTPIGRVGARKEVALFRAHNT